MRQKTMYKEIFLIMIAVILISSNVLSFAVSSQYYGGNPGNPLYLQPGESIETFFTLQNLASTEDVRLQARITEGKNIVELVDPSDIYNIPAGEKTRVNFIVTAPSDAKKGDTFPVTIMFGAITSGEGPIGLSGSIGKGFNLIIGAPSDFQVQEKKFPLLTIYAVTAIILGIITFILIRKKLSRNKTSKTKTNKF